MRWRADHGDSMLVDVAYDALVADPIAVVRGIYSRSGDELTPTAEAAMRDYLDAHPQGEHGRHAYALDDLGLDEGDLRERFADYIAAYVE